MTDHRGPCTRPECLACKAAALAPNLRRQPDPAVYVVKVLTWTDKPHGHEYQAVYPDRPPVTSLQAAMGDLLYLVRQNPGKTYRVFGSDGATHGGKVAHPQTFAVPSPML